MTRLEERLRRLEERTRRGRREPSELEVEQMRAELVAEVERHAEFARLRGEQPLTDPAEQAMVLDEIERRFSQLELASRRHRLARLGR